MDFGSIVPVTLSEGRKLELEAKMALAFEVLSDAAYALFRSDDPADIRRLRDEHLKHDGTKADPLRRYPGARRCVAEIRLIEQEVLRGYIRTMSSLCCAFEEVSRKDPPGLTFQECLGEAAWAIWSSMYTYNGRNRFTTFIFPAAKNRLSSLLRSNARNVKVGHRMRGLKSRVKQSMAGDGLEFDAAVAHVIQEENLTDAMTVRLQSAMAMTRHLNDGDDEELSYRHEPYDREEADLMWQAVRGTNLDQLERQLVEAHLRGDKQFRGRMCQQAHPETGKPHTRAALSQTFIRACEKIRSFHKIPKKNVVAA